MGEARKRAGANGDGPNIGYEEKLWAAADKLRGHMDALEYKHVVLGLIFLKYISDSFQEKFEALQAEEYADARIDFAPRRGILRSLAARPASGAYATALGGFLFGEALRAS